MTLNVGNQTWILSNGRWQAAYMDFEVHVLRDGKPHFIRAYHEVYEATPPPPYYRQQDKKAHHGYKDPIPSIYCSEPGCLQEATTL